MTKTEEELSAFVARWLVATTRSSARRAISHPSVDETAAYLLRAAGRGEVRAAAFLASPDGELVRLVAKQLMPPPARW